ncbi:hypothetical protein QM480_20565 [Flectobacillus sp. DC10W]|uniref:Uncharacterized protein n=1 Tax=Flectobacillus longus TaxID=2984207 RepID=A0ABT6YUF7_9BACT|nr:hypothetical protein [Flectobacillus longus]MDI9866743.1 hypothetical protein [Flectobacillus longus]
MKIEFIPTVGKKNEYVTNILDLFFQKIGCKSYVDLTEKYIITENAHFESVVKQINSSSSVTKNDNFVGIAKTIYNSATGKSSIIIQNHQVYPIIINVNKLIDEWSVDELDALYTTLHEFGHAKDYFIRGDLSNHLLSRPFILENVSNYYHDIIICEIGANICAKEIIPQKFRRIGRGELQKHINIAYEELIAYTSYYERNLDRDKRFKLVGLISVVILKIQEFYIHRDQPNEEIFSSLDNHINVLIKEWINNLEKNYPNCLHSSEEFNNLIVLIIKSLCINL